MKKFDDEMVNIFRPLARMSYLSMALPIFSCNTHVLVLLSMRIMAQMFVTKETFLNKIVTEGRFAPWKHTLEVFPLHKIYNLFFSPLSFMGFGFVSIVMLQ